MDLFDKKDIKPMLIGIEKETNNDEEYINELKLDGIRCVAYLDKNSVDLRNKRNDKINSKRLIFLLKILFIILKKYKFNVNINI